MTKRIFKLRNVAEIFACLALVAVFVSCVQSSNTGATEKVITTEPNAVSSTETQIAKSNAPVDIALTFINLWVDNCNKMKESIGIIEWVNSNDLTTNRFKTEVKTIIEEAYKEDPELGLDFDPIFDAQDYPDDGFELDFFDSKTNFIVVKGKNWADFKLTVKMVLENDKWLVEGCRIVNIPNDKRSTR
jgi:hypothetical protein